VSPLAAVDEASVTPGVLGFLVIFALGMATWLLLRSMTRQLKRIDFEDPAEDPHGEGDEPVEPTGNGGADR
jgi:hypothetical protein